MEKNPDGQMAFSATVGEKGQIVIPKAVRDLFGIAPGDTLLLLVDEKRGVAIPPKNAFESLAKQVFSGGESEG